MPEPATVTLHPAGETAPGPMPGDFLLTGVKSKVVVDDVGAHELRARRPHGVRVPDVRRARALLRHGRVAVHPERRHRDLLAPHSDVRADPGG